MTVDVYHDIYGDIYGATAGSGGGGLFATLAAATGIATYSSNVYGGGYQNCGCIRPVGVGHEWYSVSGCDVAGFIVSADGIEWRMANKNIYFGYHHAAAVIGSNTVANRIWGFTSRINDGASANSGQLMRGVYSSTTGLITWSHVSTIDPGAVTGGANRPRNSGRLLALDEANDAVYMGTINGIWKFTISALGGGGVSRALSGKTITGIILDPDDPTIMYASVGKADQSDTTAPPGDSGVYRLTNIRSGTVGVTSKAFNDVQDLVCVKAGANKYVYAAAMGSGPQRWSVSADVTAGWTSLSAGYNNGSNGCAKIDAHPTGTTIASIRVLCGNAGNAGNTSGGSVSNDGGATWLNQATDWNVNYVPWGETEPWWLTTLLNRVALDQSTYRANSVAIDHANPLNMLFMGRSGAWRSGNGGTIWRPSVKGICATVARHIAAMPNGGNRAAGADTDWTCVVSSPTGFLDGVANGEQPQTGHCNGVGFREDNGKLGIAIDTGEVWTTSNPFATNPTWTDNGFSAIAGAAANGIAIAKNAAGTEVILTLRDGAGIQRKVGTAAPTTVSALNTGGSAMVPHFVWPQINQPYVYCSTSTGLLRSTDYGATWTRILSYSNTSENTGNMFADPNNPDTLYFSSQDGTAGGTGLFKVTNASGSATKTKIGPSVNSCGPCAVNPISGIVYLATQGDDPFGTSLWASPASNPGASTTFVNVTDEQFASGPFNAFDMCVTWGGQILTSNHQGGYFVTTGDVAVPPPPPPPITGDVIFKAAGTTSTGAGVGSLAPGLPAGTASGDYLLCFVTGNNSTSPTFSTGGWTLALENVSGTAGTQCHLWAFAKFAGAGETAPTLTVIGGRYASQILSYTGVDLTTAIEGTATAGVLDPPLLTPTTTNATVLGFGAARGNVSAEQHNFTSSNGTVRANVTMTDTGINFGFGVTEMPDWTSGSVDPQLADSIAVSSNASITLTLKPSGETNTNVIASPSHGEGIGTANDPTVSTTNAVVSQAATATATAVANNPTITSTGSIVQVAPQTATGSGAAQSPSIAITSPITPSFVPKIEIAFATQPMSIAPIWTDITDYVLLDNELVIQRGRGDEFSRVQAGTLSLMLNNSDGRFTRGLSTSPYYPNVRSGRRIRVSYAIGGTSYIRFDGHVNEWPVVWQSPQNSPVNLTATDRFKRFGQLGELRSILEEEFLRDAVEIGSHSAAYYPLSDPAGSPRAASATKFPQGPLEIITVGAGKQVQGRESAIEFGSGTGPGTDELSAPIFAPSLTTNGKYLRADLLNEIGVVGASIECWFRVSGLGVVLDSSIINRSILVLSGRDRSQENVLALQIDGNGNLHGRKYRNGLVYQIISPTVVNDGETHHAVLTETLTGSSITSRLYLDNQVVGSSVQLSTTSTPAYTRISVGGNTWAGDLFTGTISHVAAYTGALSGSRISEHYNAGKTGLVGERTDVRIGRIATYIGLPTSERAFDVGDSTVGWQSTSGSQPITAMQEVEETENGVLFMSLDGKLTFHRRSRRYNVSPFFTLNAGFAEQINMDLQFPGDDFGLINEAIASRPRNTDVNASNQASIDEFGLYRHTTTILDDSDTRAQSVVDWIVNTYGQEVSRIPVISLDLYVMIKTNPTLLTSVITSEISHMIRLSNLPTNAPSTTMDSFIEGWTETIGTAKWSITFNCSPALLNNVWVLGVTGFSELGVTTRLAV